MLFDKTDFNDIHKHCDLSNSKFLSEIEIFSFEFFDEHVMVVDVLNHLSTCNSTLEKSKVFIKLG